jgi:glycosyltransferase involved in cell wall biosynthesis
MNGVDLEYFQPQTASVVPHICTFVGAMDYLPNIDAVTWFAEAVWPNLRMKYPNSEFRIVGRKPVERVTALASQPGIIVTGSVPDVRPHVASSSVIVAPMRISRGLQNKVLEAMAMGKPVIASPPALAALAAQPGEHLLSAQNPAEWQARLSQLFDDPDRCSTLGKSARLFVEANHNWSECLRPLTVAILDSCSVPRQPELSP